MSIKLYPDIISEGDLSPDMVLSEVDEICNAISEACKGFGTNEEALLKAMGSQTPEQRCKVHIRYKEIFGKELKDVIKSEAGKRPFGQALQFLAVDPIMAECMMIDKACGGVGTSELILSTIICGRANEDMELLKKKYFVMNSKDLGRVLDSELGGGLETLVLNCLQASQEVYDESVYTEDLRKEQIAQLHNDGLAKLGTNEAGLFKTLCATPPEALAKLNIEYALAHGLTLSKALETELGGKTRDAALFLMGMKLKPYEEVAKLINRACKGFGTAEILLITTLIRYQPIMKDVSLAHVELYSKTISDRIKSETRGDFESLLLEIIKTGEEL